MTKNGPRVYPPGTCLYVVLTRTDTLVARAIRFFTGKKFSHVSLSDDCSLDSMYSFCRDRAAFPLPAHFNEERPERDVFGMSECVPCEVYRIPINEEQYRIYRGLIAHFSSNREKYAYSLIGLVAIFFRVEREVTTRFVCSVWVGFMLRAIGIVPIRDKPLSLYEPEDFRRVPEAFLIYRGNLKGYPRRKDEPSGVGAVRAPRGGRVA